MSDYWLAPYPIAKCDRCKTGIATEQLRQRHASIPVSVETVVGIYCHACAERSLKEARKAESGGVTLRIADALA